MTDPAQDALEGESTMSENAVTGSAPVRGVSYPVQLRVTLTEDGVMFSADCLVSPDGSGPTGRGFGLNGLGEAIWQLAASMERNARAESDD